MNRKSKNSRFLVGIDLGTTHTAVAYSDTHKKSSRSIDLFEIEQLVAPGEVAAHPLLPSVRYHPADGELAESDIHLPWKTIKIGDSVCRPIIGQWARILSAKSQGRTITSCKSWLSHDSVDRNADILPWGAENDVHKVSPVIASASYLAHVRSAWNAHFENHPLEHQEVIVTIPASFDEAARSLTLDAAKLAGLNRTRLVEEPQAVCYDWLWRHKESLQNSLQNIKLLMVCDIGGGTSDFTLIKVNMENDEPSLERIGVGDHLMLGGDNIDLTLAHLAESKVSSTGHSLSSANLYQLIEQCRLLKEQMLGQNKTASGKITLLGSGSRLVGGARTIQLEREEVEKIVLDGFFPSIQSNDAPDRKRSGVVEFGLPYVADPAITKHIAVFLQRHKNAIKDAFGSSNNDGVPDAILLNGGLFQSKRITSRLLEIVSSWTNQTIHHLNNPQPDLAVAMGAVSYAMARRGEQIKIGGGSARSYFLQVADKKNKTRHGVCILPRGSEEDHEITLTKQSFLLRLGEPVRFHLVSSTDENKYAPGNLVDISDEKFASLPPLAVTLDDHAEISKREVSVQLVTSLTELGTLQMQCVAIEDQKQRWDVQFQLRNTQSGTNSDNKLPAKYNDAIIRIEQVFGNKSQQSGSKAIKGLRNDVEKMLGTRSTWNPSLLRELLAIFLSGSKNRRRSANHERVWLSFSGFCLRPGFGVDLDDWRIEQLWRIYAANPQFVNETQNWTEWWTLWRRVAGGLDESQQIQIYDSICKYINPVTARQGKTATQMKKRGYEDMVRLSGVLERLPIAHKVNIGEWLLKRLEKPGEPAQSWWAIGRIGARVPFHGSIHNVITKETATQWLQTMLTHDWKKHQHIAFAATMISRMSGDRERDLATTDRNQVMEKLQNAKAPQSWTTLLQQVTKLEESDTRRIFGEALPPGLKLLQ